jgi:membrane associated rhomboid family serine protease
MRSQSGSEPPHPSLSWIESPSLVRGARPHFVDNLRWLRYPRGMRLSGRKYFHETQRWSHHQQIILLSLIGVNVAFFITQLFLEAFQPGFVSDWNLALSGRGIRDAYSWQFITAMFLHYGPWHLLGNMLVLYLLGRDLESILGSKHFLYLYFAGAIAGELGHLFLMPTDCLLLAASGGVAAVVAAYATILPELELTGMMLFGPVHLKAKHLAYVAFGVSLLLICVHRTGIIIHGAFLGGCAAGWFYAHLLGFGRPWVWQRFLRQRRAEAERHEQMSVDQVMSEEIDPLLEKISRDGVTSLSRSERRLLFRARDKILRKTISD